MRILELQVNGDRTEVAAPEHWTLLEVLRYKLGLTGSKQGCDKGDCGACTVLIDGRPVLSCLTLGALAQGKQVTTIEGLGRPDTLSAVQEAFVEEYGLQCGYCTPGMVLAAHALLADQPDPTDEDVREALAGNLCMCTGYVQIVRAVLSAAKKLQGAPR